MARLLKSSFGLQIDTDAAVGSSGPNQREDSGIVQYCLSVLSAGCPLRSAAAADVVLTDPFAPPWLKVAFPI